MLIYKVIKGEKAAVELLKRMKVLQNDWISWRESFAHIGDITLERIYEPEPFWVNETPEEIIKLAKGE